MRNSSPPSLKKIPTVPLQRYTKRKTSMHWMERKPMRFVNGCRNNYLGQPGRAKNSLKGFLDKLIKRQKRSINTKMIYSRRFLKRKIIPPLLAPHLAKNRKKTSWIREFSNLKQRKVNLNLTSSWRTLKMPKVWIFSSEPQSIISVLRLSINGVMAKMTQWCWSVPSLERQLQDTLTTNGTR